MCWCGGALCYSWFWHFLFCAVQSTVDLFMKHLGVSEEEARSLIKLSVSLAKEAREEYMKENPGSAVPLIAGSVGPYGSQFYDELFTYTGKYVDTVTAQVCTYLVCMPYTALMYLHSVFGVCSTIVYLHGVYGVYRQH